MPDTRALRSDDAQVDPFSAGEPELPWGDPDPLDEPTDEAAGEPGGYAPHGEPGGEPHKGDDGYRAPTLPPRDYDAPSTDDAARPRRTRAHRRRRSPSGPSDGAEARARHRTGRVVSRIVLAIVALSVVSSLVVPIVSCVADVGASVGEGVSDVLDGLLEGPSDPDYDDHDPVADMDEQDRAAADAAAEALAGATADADAGTAHDLAAAYLDRKLEDIEGVGADELGIDPDAWASRLVSQLEVGQVHAYAFGDGTASAYADITCPSASETFWEADDALASYLIDEGLWPLDSGSPLTAGQRDRAREVFDAALDSADVEARTLSQNVRLTLGDDGWVVDEQSLEDALSSALGLY